MTLVLLHGWGFDRHFWDPLRKRLADIDTIAWDLGYYGEPVMTLPSYGAVAVGHSFGLLWLLRHRPFAWRRLISVNGFSRFAAGDDFPEGVALPQIERLSSELEQTPFATVAAFRQRCGARGMPPERVEEDRLQSSLGDLRHWDERRAAVDLALCGEADKVVPPALSRACFPAERMIWHRGGHLLPLEDPDWCAAQLRPFIVEPA
jgi:pimeloyl-[acyl-carrier protein] methyl ester esterase